MTFLLLLALNLGGVIYNYAFSGPRWITVLCAVNSLITAFILWSIYHDPLFALILWQHALACELGMP